MGPFNSPFRTFSHSPVVRPKIGRLLRPQRGGNKVLRILFSFIGFCTLISVGEIAIKMNYRMATHAKHAFEQDQISYEKFTKAMIEAKPRHTSKK